MNEEIPKDIPVKLPGPSYSVISRLVLLDGSEEYRPSKAVRWSRSHVMIKLQERDGIEPEYVCYASRMFSGCSGSRRPQPVDHRARAGRAIAKLLGPRKADVRGRVDAPTGRRVEPGGAVTMTAVA